MGLLARVEAGRVRRRGAWRLAIDKAERERMAKLAEAIQNSADGGLLIHAAVEAGRG